MILAILQARFTSTRLPGKVLKPILGKPILWHQIERIQRATLIDNLILGTSTDNTDDAIEILCNNSRLPCFRGSLNDVLDRFYQAAKPVDPDHIVRLTGDCPLADPQLIDQVIAFHLQGNYDYTSNTIEPTFPDGLDVEVLRFACLEQAWREARLPSQREHVTPFIHQQPFRFKIGSFRNTNDLSYLRWTVDEPLDFDLISRIYEKLYPANPEFNMQDILALLELNPELTTLNTQYHRNEGYQKSLAQDAEFLDKRE
jgi:spore coat polysaccharide biosynthesis protein SpsF